MAAIKVIVFILFWSLNSMAAWGLVVQQGGYMGQTSLGGIYTWDERNAVEFSIGNYIASQVENYQLNLGYRWSPWKTSVAGLTWAPVQLGVFLIAAINKTRYFTESPEYYPSEDYYDQTAVRGALQLSSSLFFSGDKAALVYHLSVLENGLNAIYNNDWRNLNYFWSSGLALQIYF